jgi:hypothetical protein
MYFLSFTAMKLFPLAGAPTIMMHNFSWKTFIDGEGRSICDWKAQFYSPATREVAFLVRFVCATSPVHL